MASGAGGSQEAAAGWWRRPAWLRRHVIQGGSYAIQELNRLSQPRRSTVVGPQTHRLPFSVMWGITLLTAIGMALINFLTILVIEFLVTTKFKTMQLAIMNGGVGFGIFTLILFSMGYAFVGVCLIQAFAPNCAGSGLPENKCYLNGSNMHGLFTKTTLAIRMITTILANAAGFPVGREGPTVTIGSNLAFLVSRRVAFPYVREWVDLSRQGGVGTLVVDDQRFAHATRIQCAVGGACAMAMIFNAPVGGLLYMFEEITSAAWPLELTFRVFVATMCCALMSYGLCTVTGSEMEEFVIYAQRPASKEWEWTDIVVLIIVSAMLGVITSLHTRAMLAISKRRQRWTLARHRLQVIARMVETVLYAALCALLASIASLMDECVKKGESGLQYVRFNCAEGEYNPVASLLVTTSHSSLKLLFSGTNAGEISAGSSILAFLVYFTLNVGLAGLPVPGGAFTATMLLGALYGRSIGELCRDLGIGTTVSGVYAVVGSACMLCGFKQMTLAAVMIVVECINDLRLAPIIMLGVAISISINWIMNERGHDEEQIVRKKLPLLEGDAPHELDAAVALSLCDAVPEEAMLPPEASVDVVKRARDTQVQYFPIVAPDGGRCVGIVTRPHLEAALQAALGDPGDLGANGAGLRSSVASAPVSFLSARSIAFLEGADEHDCDGVTAAINESIPRGDTLPLSRIMDPTPFTVVEDMPVPRLYALFAKAGERAACVVSASGEFRGIISREGLITATRSPPAPPPAVAA